MNCRSLHPEYRDVPCARAFRHKGRHRAAEADGGYEWEQPRTGRPPVEERRVSRSFTVALATTKMLSALARKRGEKPGVVLDDLVRRAHSRLRA